MVERIAEQVEAMYFDPQAAARIAGRASRRLAAGRFDALRDPRELAASLTDRLRPHDAHFSVAVDAAGADAYAGPRAPARLQCTAPPPRSAADAAARENHGFRRVEVLPGNVGLIELTLFGHFEPDEPVRDRRATRPTPRWRCSRARRR